MTGTVVETVDAITVEHPVERGGVLRASDLTVLRRPKTEASAVLTNMGGAVGLAARHQLLPGQMLSGADLMKPEVIQRGDFVTIVYQAPGVTLTLRGLAQEAGAVGDTINVLNTESKHAMQAIVAGPGRVMVGAVTTRVVDNGAERPSSCASTRLVERLVRCRARFTDALRFVVDGCRVQRRLFCL